MRAAPGAHYPVRANMASESTCEPCVSTCESHSYGKLTVLKWVLGLKNCLSALFEMGAYT